MTKLQQFTGKHLAEKLIPAEKRYRYGLQLATYILAMACLLIAAAGPRSTRRSEQEVTLRGRDIVLLIDVSRSMLANDVHPSRLGRAQADMLDILDALRPGDRIALVAFRNKATRITPFTSDKTFLSQSISGLSIHSAPPGETDIGNAIKNALEIFEDDNPSHKAVVMISDGDDLSGEALSAAQEAAKRSIPFFTVGLGSRTGSTIPNPTRNGDLLRHEGETVVTKLSEEPLITLARLTNGAYIPVETAGIGAVTLGQRLQENLQKVEMQTFAAMESVNHTELFAFFLLPAILLLIVTGSVSKGRLKTGCRMLLCSVLLYQAQPLAAETNANAIVDFSRPANAIARDAQKLYNAGKYDEAAILYRDAATHPEANTEKQQRYKYNAAISAMQAGNLNLATNLIQGLPSMHQTDLLEALTLYQSGNRAADGSADGYRKRLEHWQKAANLLQNLSQTADQADTGNDLLKLDSMIPEAAQAAHVADVLEKYAEEDPATFARKIMEAQRSQYDALQNTPPPPVGPDRLTYFEDKAKQQKELSDQYLALTHSLQTNQSIQATLPLDQLWGEQAKLQQQSEFLRDLHVPDATSTPEVGHPLYNAWKNIGTPESLLEESLRQQAWLKSLAEKDESARPPPVSKSDLQSEASTLTELFADRYQAPPDTEPETQEKIASLSADAARLQRLAAEMLNVGDEESAKPVQAEAEDILKQLQQILPKPPQQDNQQDDQNNDQKNEDQQNDSQENEQNEDNQDDAPAEPPPSGDEQNPDDPEENAPPPDAQDQDEQNDTFDIDAMLEQVEERAQEYQDEMQERKGRARRKPGARDW